MGLGKLLRRWLWDDPALGYDDPGNDPMSCPAITFPAIDQTFYRKLYDQAVAAGVKFDGQQAEINGIVLDWNYDVQTQTLSVTCLKKPFFISCADVDNRVADLIQKAKKEGI